MGVVAVVLGGYLGGDTVGGGEVLVGEDGGWGALGDGVAGLGEEEDVLGVGEEFFEVVGDGDHGGPPPTAFGIILSVDAMEGGEEGFAGGEVEAGGGFVEDEEFGFAYEGAGEEGACVVRWRGCCRVGGFGFAGRLVGGVEWRVGVVIRWGGSRRW